MTFRLGADVAFTVSEAEEIDAEAEEIDAEAAETDMAEDSDADAEEIDAEADRDTGASFAVSLYTRAMGTGTMLPNKSQRWRSGTSCDGEL